MPNKVTGWDLLLVDWMLVIIFNKSILTLKKESVQLQLSAYSSTLTDSVFDQRINVYGGFY